MSDPAARFRRNAERFTELVDAVPADAWGAASPCAGWTASDVLAHVVTTQAEFLARMGFASAPLDGPALPDPSDPSDPAELRSRWVAVRDLVQGALDDPATVDTPFDGYFGPTTFAATIDGFYSADLTVHRWDIARATGLRSWEEIDPDEAEHITAGLSQVDEQVMRSPGVMGPAVAPPPDADATERLVAWLGRDPRTEPTPAADSPTGG